MSIGGVLSQVKDVEIDGSGIFKYVLIKIIDENKNNKLVVRGNIHGEYHADIFEEFEQQVSKQKITSKCLGGGRIEHRPQKKYIKVYGYSQGYGKADHATAVNIIKTQYSDYNIEWCNDGY